MSVAFTISRAENLDQPGLIAGLAQLLVDCVQGGASVSFMHPLDQTQAEDFWRKLSADVALEKRALLVARNDQGTVIGTVQAIFDLPPNQPHRADIAKLLVHRSARKAGVGAALIKEIERISRAAGRTLLVLDTVTGGDAERLYRRLEWQVCGEIPGYALMPDGTLCGTTVFYKALHPKAC